LIEQKGLTHLLDVIHILKKRHNNFVIVIAGEGRLRNELEEKSKRLGLEDTVFFLGWLGNAASKILPVIDIFIQSSLWEAMSMVLLEAMAAGRPIVTTNVGENSHVIDSGENGFVVGPGDVHAMAEALEKLILNEELRARFGLRAKQKYEKYFTAEIMTRNYERIYLDILDE
jgi:glycosyltransferase involved in cell wall biosynthesis